MTRIVAISDTHSLHCNLVLPEGDILIHCGDFSNICSLKEIESFANWFSNQKHKHKILIFGNHDVVTDIKFYNKYWLEFHDKKISLPKTYWQDKGIITLVNEVIEIEGIKFWGHPGMPWDQKDWAWSLETWHESDKLFSNIPRDVDIVLTHSPPYGILDKGLIRNNIGNEEFAVRVHEIKPRACIFGHVHKPGFVVNEQGTSFYNVSNCIDTSYGPKIAFNPTIIDFEK